VRAVIRWAIENSPAMNILMLSILVVGAVSLSMLRREIFPEFELEIILVTVPYPGATPAEVEEGICQKIEEAVRSISGLKKQVAVAQENAGFMVLYLESNVNVQKILNEVRAEIDRIPSFPDLAEDPDVQQLTFRLPAIRVGLIGPDEHSVEAEVELRQIAETIRSELLQLPSVSQAELLNVKDYQIDVEIPEPTLRKYGLTLQQVARIIRRENIELPGGKLNTPTQEVLLRGKNKRLTGEEIARIPLVTTSTGVVLTVGDLGRVRDEFEDVTAINRVDGQPALVIGINRTSSEDLLAIAREVKDYVAEKQSQLPPGYSLRTWQDASVDVKDRLDLLLRNGLQGLVLVFLVLAVFLELKLAFWVALGIPVAVMGAGGVLLGFDQTLNMLSMFAFLLVLGIVVDDAIVVGENIYVHRARHESLVQAAVDGTREVLPSVATSVTTTIIAFVPLFFVSGVMGKFIAVMPIAVIAMLAISLLESTLILPCHLAHRDNLFLRVVGIVLYPLRPVAALFRRINAFTHRAVHRLTSHGYLPALGWCLSHPPIVISIALSLLIATVGIVRSGITPWILFPKLDNRTIEVKIAYPDGTPSEVTDRATRRLEDAIRRVDQRYAEQGKSIMTILHRSVGEFSGAGSLGPDSRNSGGHIGAVYVELIEPSERDVVSETILQQWRDEAGEFPGAERLTFGSPEMGPGGRPIEFKLLAPPDQIEQLEAAVAKCRQELTRHPGVFDIRDDSSPGKWEYQLRIKDNALAMGVSAADLAETVRASFHGEEVMRLQRGRHEVKLMVRYPREQRRWLGDFEAVRVRMDDGAERPLTELADVTIRRGYSEINRLDQMRSITITADVDEKQGNASRIVSEIQAEFMPGLFEEFPEIQVRWEGQREDSRESMASLYVGFLLAVFAMYCLLTLEFRSYFQPFIILLIIPFGFMGAIWGHALLGLPLTMLSMFGLVALTGVVVNDSIVLVDFINHRVRAGTPIRTALLEAGRRRLRPVLLTSITTVAGLTPLLLETSFQAQVLIPMAASLCFGLMASTGLVLLVVPTLYLVYVQLFAPKTYDIHVDEYEVPVGMHAEPAIAHRSG
jgi:hydrophobic/amphiphilic exporter-1 (mainly G- bacteria), HAE1 family